ncbi:MULTISPECIES: (2Fe-2S)-binding protein [Achromobacter]|uniref:(2Fe-2S)-binding protein n=1 Tax=Achromobacter spanius TaxID=217203 RepID=A0ABY8GPT6_9BURK|nr:MULTISPECIES: (2Fe-2S)-binding protein [Achromobacter]WAI84162.1 (2Fe-2S)-binding protein [Achromobacter spanius]WEX94245.1 (2Fe-2S)-binding protein [Achromobacter sp. SS2-2022]WFP06593.1 (2Fe-2S)-binding protein [Achromobacter spanius]
MAILKRLAETARPAVPFTLDGQACQALAGDTVLTAVLTQAESLRQSEFSGAPRAGFCMMGACQDCWMQLENGSRLRACSTFIEPGMRLQSAPLPPAAVPGTLAVAAWPEDDIA